jgi:acyl-CoA thioester hydrolase
MSEFRFYQPIHVRYGDIDSQRHVNNAAFFTYMEQARVSYFQNLDLWDGVDFDNLGFILLEMILTYKAPIHYGQPIRVGVRVERLGNKSMNVFSVIEDSETGQEMAIGKAVVVAYDYSKSQSILIPEDWRRVVEEFEGMDVEG